MYYTLSDFLKENKIPEIRLLTERKSFDDVIIKAISVQELPAQTFIDHNELVLSTAIGCQNETIFLRLIEELSHAAAVFLTFFDENFAVPPSVIDLANSRGLPLFWIPWEYRFYEIQEYVLERIQNKKVEVYHRLQVDLFNSFFETGSLQDATLLIESVLKRPVSILDKKRKLLGCSRYTPISHNELSEDFELPICVGESLFGYLIFHFVSPESPPLEKESILNRFICFPLSLWFQRKSTEELLVSKLKDDFVWNLASGSYHSFQDMVIQGNNLRFDLTCPYTCVILRVVADSDYGTNNQYSNEAAISVSSIETLLIVSAQKHQLKAMVAGRSFEFVAYLENKGDQPVQKINSFLDYMDKELKQMFSNYSFYWGISEVSLKPSNFGQLYKNASIALQHSLNSNKARYRCTYQDTKESQILSILSSNREVQQLVQETIGKLRIYDLDSNIDLMGTLMEYIKCNYNASQTARNLHIHRQSLLYRFEKIEELTELSLNRHQDLFLLEVCARILIGDNHI